MLLPRSEDEILEKYRIDKINFVWQKMSQKERLKTILGLCSIAIIDDAIKEVISLERDVLDENSENSGVTFEEAKHDFIMLSAEEQVDYLLKYLCFVENLDLWIERENEILANEILKSKINQHRWFEVLPNNVISEEQLNRSVLELATYKDDYFVSGIKQVLDAVNKSSIDELTDEEKLMIYVLGQPTY